MATVTGAFLILMPTITTMIIMMLTTLATMSRKESPLTGSPCCGMGRGMGVMNDE